MNYGATALGLCPNTHRLVQGPLHTLGCRGLWPFLPMAGLFLHVSVPKGFSPAMAPVLPEACPLTSHFLETHNTWIQRMRFPPAPQHLAPGSQVQSSRWWPQIKLQPTVLAVSRHFLSNLHLPAVLSRLSPHSTVRGANGGPEGRSPSQGESPWELGHGPRMAG